MSETNQLPIPETALRDPKSFELLRVWIASEDQHISLRSEVWADPAAWGILLVDLARHVAESFERGSQLNRSDALARIREGLDAEWDHPTS